MGPTRTGRTRLSEFSKTGHTLECVRSLLRRYPMPVVFIVAFCVMSAVYVGIGASGRRDIVAATATNVHNLHTDPIGTLIASAFVAEGVPWFWVVFAVVGLFPLVQRFGNTRALLLILAAHVVGTLISEGLVAVRISLGELPESMRLLDDVGPSYVIAAALIATILYGPKVLGRTNGKWWRAGAAVGLILLIPSLFEGVEHLDVAAVGHIIALTTGAGLGLFYVRSERRAVEPAPSMATGPQ